MEDRLRDRGMNTACRACLSRRAFLGQSALAAAALLAACGDGQIGGGGTTGPIQSVTVTASAFPGLATVDTLVDINAQIAAKRTGPATFVAFSRACTHEGTRIDLVQTGFFCPSHGSQFDNNGHVTAGPATRDLDKLPTTYDPATDQLTIG
jgi:Rieske Fe-S protein